MPKANGLNRMNLCSHFSRSSNYQSKRMSQLYRLQSTSEIIARRQYRTLALDIVECIVHCRLVVYIFRQIFKTINFYFYFHKYIWGIQLLGYYCFHHAFCSLLWLSFQHAARPWMSGHSVRWWSPVHDSTSRTTDLTFDI